MKNTLLRRSLYCLAFAGILVTQTGCPGVDKTVSPPAHLPAADKIAGMFSGTGKYLPGDISLGNTFACVAPPMDYQLKYQSGAATVNITKLTDSTITITLLTGPFPQDKYTSLIVKENGNVISLGSLGYYDTDTRALSFSGTAPNFNYSYLKNCKTGLPYYYSTSAVPDPNQVAHFTIKRYEFGGVKQ